MPVTLALSWLAVMAAVIGGAPIISSGSDDDAPVQLSAAQIPAADAREPATDSTQRSAGNPAKPTCATLGMPPSAEKASVPGGSACGVPSNAADGASLTDRSDERIDVATFLAWHVQAHNLIDYIYQTTPSSASRTDAQRKGARQR